MSLAGLVVFSAFVVAALIRVVLTVKLISAFRGSKWPSAPAVSSECDTPEGQDMRETDWPFVVAILALRGGDELMRSQTSAMNPQGNELLSRLFGFVIVMPVLSDKIPIRDVSLI